VKDCLLGGKADLSEESGSTNYWCLTCGGQIRVLGTQLLDPVEDQSAQYPTG
jgi:hypothetical protein